MNEEKIIIKQSTPIYGTLGIIFGFIGVFILSPLFSPLALILGSLACLQKEYTLPDIEYCFCNFRYRHFTYTYGAS